jgi:membrane protease YdiL (CAAX protease family)
VPFSLMILTSIAGYVWFVEGRAPREWVYVPGGLVLLLTVWHNARRGEWGFASGAFLPGLRWTLLVTAPLVLVILAAGAAAGTLHDRRDFLGSLAPLVLWGWAQQWVLQTVVLREAQRVTSRRAGILLAALLFGAVHLPNPFLAPVTFGASLVWCRIYDRWPNVLPIALSHGLGTLAILYAFDGSITGRLRIGASYLRLEP